MIAPTRICIGVGVIIANRSCGGVICSRLSALEKNANTSLRGLETNVRVDRTCCPCAITEASTGLTDSSDRSRSNRSDIFAVHWRHGWISGKHERGEARTRSVAGIGVAAIAATGDRSISVRTQAADRA